MTGDIVEFIRARLEDDRLEATPHTIMHSGGPPGGYIPNCVGPTGHGCPERWMIDAPDPAAEHAHAMTHATAKQLRELRGVEAKRRLLDRHKPTDGELPVYNDQTDEFVEMRPILVCGMCSTGHSCGCCFDVRDAPDAVWPCAEVRLLASKWADHPDYRNEEWKP